MKNQDKKVLSVPAGKTLIHLTEHNVYSCPQTWPKHDLKVSLLAPRDGDGTMHRVYVINERITINPRLLNFHPETSKEMMASVRTYINAVNHIPGIIVGEGDYRFYFLSDLNNGALPQSPKLEPTGPIHCYLSLVDLLTSSLVRPLEICS
jgi:hypothetical protein